jgi:hypothetical protein
MITALVIVFGLWTVAAFVLCLYLCAAAAKPAPGFETPDGAALKSREPLAPIVAEHKDPLFCFNSVPMYTKQARVEDHNAAWRAGTTE